MTERKGTIKRFNLDKSDGASATGAALATRQDLEQIRTELEKIDLDLAAVEADGGGGGGTTRTFTSVDALSAGDFVSIRSDGQVEAVVDATVGGPFATGTPDTVQDTAITGEHYAALNVVTNRVVSVWARGSATYGAVGEIVGDGSINWSEEQELIDHIVSTQAARLADIPGTNNVAFFFEDTTIGSDGAIRVSILTVNTDPDSLTFNTPVTVHSAAIGELMISDFIGYDPVEERLVVLYSSGASGANGSVRIGEVSGTTTSWGSETDFTSETPIGITASYDVNAAKWLVSWSAVGGTPLREGVSRVMTVDAGTESASFGTEAQFKGARADQIVQAYSPTEMVHVIAYQDVSGGEAIDSRVATVSGTSVSFGTEAVVSDVESDRPVSMIHSAVLDEMILTCQTKDSFIGFVIQGTISGTNISWDDQNTFVADSAAGDIGDQVTIDLPGPEAEIIVVYEDILPEIRSQIIHLEQAVTPFTNADDWIAVATEAIDQDGSGEFTLLGGVNANQSGLTPGQKLYLADDGTLTASDNGRPAGIALSATEILLSNVRLG